MEKEYNRSTSESNIENTNAMDRHEIGKTLGQKE